MAQELLLIPREEYETLLAENEQKTIKADIDVTAPKVEMSMNQDNITRTNDTCMSKELDSVHCHEHMDSAHETGKSKRKVRGNTEGKIKSKMKGAGKQYVRQSMEKF